MVRTPCYDKRTGRKKGAWSAEEDDKLRAYVQRYGHWNWRELPKYAGLSRCGKSCRLRWMNYLRPNVKRGNYTEEEEDIIIKLHEELGNKWSAMAAKLPGRTDNEIKNHWHTHLNKRVKQNQSTTDNVRSKANKNTGFEPKKDVADDDLSPQPLILESSSSTEISSSPSSDGAVQSSGLNRVGEDSSITSLESFSEPIGEDSSITSLESFSEPIEDFWNSPFLADTSYYNQQNDFLTSPLVEGGFFSDPFDLYYDDVAMEFLYQP